MNKLPTRPRDSSYIVYLDNLFGSTKLVSYFCEIGYGTVATARTNSGICAEFVKKKQLDKKADIEPWGQQYQAPTISNQIMQFAWKDNALVLFFFTVHTGLEPKVVRHRKRPSSTSTSACTAHAVFGSKPSKDLPIPQFVDNYNYCIGGVDQADQLRNTNPGLWPITKGGWRVLWHFLFNVTLVNSYLLSGFKDQYKFRTELLYTLFLKGTRQTWKRIQGRTIE